MLEDRDISEIVDEINTLEDVSRAEKMLLRMIVRIGAEYVQER